MRLLDAKAGLHMKSSFFGVVDPSLSLSQDDTRVAILQFQKTLSAKFTKDVRIPKFAASSGLEYIFFHAITAITTTPKRKTIHAHSYLSLFHLG